MNTDSIGAKWAAELFGTFWLVFGGCGSAIFAAKFVTGADGADGITHQVQLGIGFLGVALAFGLTVMTMVYAVGWISGGHFNPAVTLGAAASGRFPWKDVLGYWVAQVVGGLLAGLALWGIASGKPGWDRIGNMAANGFGDHSPGSYSMLAVLIAEVLLTGFFVIIILGATHGSAPVGFAGIAIGLALTLIHLISIPISNTSVNPARSTAVAFFNGNGAPGQLWLFWLAPLIGGLLGGVLFPLIWERTPFADVDIRGVE
ncbi:MAG: aquaporin Z [Nocardioides sp.]